MSNGVFTGISFSWSTYISGDEQVTYHNGDKISFDTNIGTLFEFDESHKYDVRDPNSGNIVGTLGITADKVTITFNQAADDLHFTQYGGYLATSDSTFKAKPIQTGTTDITKQLTIGDASADVKWVGLTKTVKPVVRGHGSISPGIITTIPDGSSKEFTFTPNTDKGETVVSVTLIKPDGTEVPIQGIPATGGTCTIKGDDLALGQSQLVATFTTNNLGGIDDSAIVKEDWKAAVGTSARLNIYVAGDETTSLYKNQGSSIDSDMQKEALIVEDTLPGQGTFEGLTIKAVLPDWAEKDGVTYPVRDLGGFEWNNSADMTGYMNKLTQYYNINNVPGNNESYGDFKNRVLAAPMNWGIYVDSDNNSTLIINFGSPASPNPGTPSYSDFWAARLAADPTLNKIVGDDNCVKGKVQYFAINYYATHRMTDGKADYTNTVTAKYSDGNNTPYKESASAAYQIDNTTSFALGAMGHIAINKRDAANQDTKIEGAEFKLQIKNDKGKWVDYTGTKVSGATDVNGKLDLSPLIVGEYKLVETKVPTGYQAGTVEYSTLPGSVESINADGTFKVTADDLTKDKGLGVIVTNKKSGHTVTYDKNGGVDVSGTVEDPNSPYANGDFWTVLGANGILTWAGHYFTGWNTAADGTGKRYPVGATYECNDKNGDIYLYAQWKEKSPRAVASPNVTKAFTTDSAARPDAKANFEFDIKQTDGTTVEGLTETATQSDAGTLTSAFGDRVMFPGVGTYKFTISEKNTGAAGYTYDDTTYTWTVVITEPKVSDADYTPTGYAATSTLVNNKTGKAVNTGATFTNKYEPAAADAIASPTVTKTVDGPVPSGTDKTFDFTCTAASTNPADGVTGLATSASITGAGDKSDAFGTNADGTPSVVFSKAGTYVYTIAETAGTSNGYTYDTTKYTWTVEVTDDNGKLKTNTKLTEQGKTAEAKTAGFANTYAVVTNGSYSIPAVTKNVTGSFDEATPFTFTITGEGSAPMPATTTATATVNPGDTSATANFGSISYTAAGTYRYQIAETNSGAVGWTYDTSTYGIEVVVTDSEGTLNAAGTVTKGASAVSAIEFSNDYELAPSDAIASPMVTKVVNGPVPSGTDKTFNFTCSAAATNPAGATGVDTMASITGAGDVAAAFGGSAVFSKAGTYVYTIAEIAGTDAGYTYDDTKYTWTVDVAPNTAGNKLIATGKLTKLGETAEVTAATFTNTYAVVANGTYVVPTVTKMVTGLFPRAASFNYAIAGEAGAPMPATTTVDIDINLGDTSATASFGSITYTAAGTYTYHVTETDGGLGGWIYDNSEFDIEVVVTDNSGILSADGTVTEDGDAAIAIGFFNTYQVIPSDAIASPAVTKAVSGPVPSGAAKTFNFTCSADAGNPTGGVTGLVGAADITGAGDIAAAFGESVVFSKPGTYVFTIAEKTGVEAGYTYDDTKYTWTVEVIDVNGKLTTTSSLTEQGQATQVAKADFANTYAVMADTTYGIPTITKNVTGAERSQAAQFGFEITGENGAPMPATTTAIATINPGDNSATANLGSIAYTAAGTYTYHITEIKPADVNGWAYDATTYDIEVVVTDTDATLSAVGTVTKAGEVASAIEFTNDYAPLSVTLADPPVGKTISGTEPATADEFTFKMVGVSGAPMPSDAVGDTVLRTLKGAGEVEMGYITYTATGTYTYKVSEVAGTSKNYTYDNTVFDMTVVVTDNNGQLEATRTIEKNATSVAKAEFDNKFASGTSVQVDKVADKTDAKPGEEINYTITILNTGDSKAVGVWVKDVIPAGTTFVSCDDSGVVSDDKSYVNWFAPESEPGEESAISCVLTVRVNDNFAEGEQISNTAKYELTANPDAPDFTTDPEGSDTPTAATKVAASQGDNPKPATESTTANNTSTAKTVSAATGDTILPMVAVAGALLAAGCAAFYARRRRSRS